MDEITKSLAAQGPLVAMAGLVIWWLIQDRKAIQGELRDLTKAYQKASDDCADEMLAEREKRVMEQKEATQALRESNRALKETADALLSTRKP